MTSVSLSMHSCVTFGRSFFETKSTLDSEWFRILVTSLADDSGRIGMAMRPNGTVENNATVHSGMFCARIATLSDAPIPNCVNLFDSISHVRLNCSYVYSCSVSMTFDIRFFAYLRVEYSYSLPRVSMYDSLNELLCLLKFMFFPNLAANVSTMYESFVTKKGG